MADETDERQYLPACWNDHAKITAYFSPFRTAVANQEGVESKIAFWKTCINAFCRTTNKSMFDVKELGEAFIRNGRTPQCLSTVLEEMIRSKEVYELNEFFKNKPSRPLTWPAWTLEVVKVPLSWTLRKITHAILPKTLGSDEKYIHLGVVQERASEVLLQRSTFGDEVFSLSQLMEKCNWPECKTQDAMLAIYWLYCQNQACMMYFDLAFPSKALIKLAPQSPSQPIQISETDLCKYKLNQLIHEIEAKIADYEAKCSKAKEEARALISKSKVLALSQLRKKKMFEQIVIREANVLSNVQELLESFKQAESNQEIIDIMKTANAALKKSHNSMSEESVLQVMDDIRENIDTQNEISTAISQPIISDGDIETDLAALEQELAAEQDLCDWIEKMKLPDLPDPLIPKRTDKTPTEAECL